MTPDLYVQLEVPGMPRDRLREIAGLSATRPGMRVFYNKWTKAHEVDVTRQELMEILRAGRIGTLTRYRVPAG